MTVTRTTTSDRRKRAMIGRGVLLAGVAALVLGLAAAPVQAHHGGRRGFHRAHHGHAARVTYATRGDYRAGYAAGRAAGWRAGFRAGRFGRPFRFVVPERYGCSVRYARGFRAGFIDSYRRGFREGRRVWLSSRRGYCRR